MLRNNNRRGNQAPVQNKTQLTVRDFAPMQEVADSIYDNLVKVSYLKREEEKEFKVLKRRISMQALCMQGILEDGKFNESEQLKSLMCFFITQRKNKDNSFYVRECLKDVVSILKNDLTIDSFTFNKQTHPSSNALTNFFKSQNYIDERMELSELDPEAYQNSAKIPLHRSDKDTNALFKIQDKDNQKNTGSRLEDSKGESCRECTSPKSGNDSDDVNPQENYEEHFDKKGKDNDENVLNEKYTKESSTENSKGKPTRNEEEKTITEDKNNFDIDGKKTPESNGETTTTEGEEITTIVCEDAATLVRETKTTVDQQNPELNEEITKVDKEIPVKDPIVAPNNNPNNAPSQGKGSNHLISNTNDCQHTQKLNDQYKTAKSKKK